MTRDEAIERAAHHAGELVRALAVAFAPVVASPTPAAPMTRAELAAAMSWSLASVDRNVKRGCPFVSAKPRRFDLEAVRAWAASDNAKTPAPSAKVSAATKRALEAAGVRVTR